MLDYVVSTLAGIAVGFGAGYAIITNVVEPHPEALVTVGLCAGSGAVSGNIYGGIGPLLGGIIGGILGVGFGILGLFPPGAGIEETLTLIVVPAILAPIMMAIWGL